MNNKNKKVAVRNDHDGDCKNRGCFFLNKIVEL